MAVELTGLRPRRPDPPKPVCAVCGPTWDADRGFPGGISYCTRHVPPHLRFPWEAGYAAPSTEAATEAAAPAPTAQLIPLQGQESAPDLFGSVPA